MKNQVSDQDRESILITLDQLSQTMEVMNSVVSRLKQRVERDYDCNQESTASSSKLRAQPLH